MATLADLQDVLKSIDTNIITQGAALTTLSSNFQSFIDISQRNDRLGSTDTSVLEPVNTFSSNVGAGIGSGIAAIGGGLGAGVGIASGIAGAGVGIAGFFTALAGADAAIGAFGDGSNLKVLMGNVAEGLASFGSRDLAALGALLAGSVLFSSYAGVGSILKAPVGLGAIGLGIGAFFSGLAIGDEASSFTNNNLSGFPDKMKNLAEGLSAFSDRDLTALGTLLASSTLFSSYAGVGSILKAPVGLGAIGLGIGAFFSGLAIGDELSAMSGNDLSGFSDKMKNLAEGLGAFGDRDLTALGGLLASSALFGAVAGPVAGLKAATGMTLLGAGIGGFFSGLAFAGGLPSDNGENLKNTMVNLSDGLKAFDTTHLIALGTIMGVGGILGATGNTGKSIATATGMGIMGLGIGGFIAGMGAVGDIAEYLGSDGSGMKTIMTNIADGLKAFDTAHLIALGSAMGIGAAVGSSGAGNLLLVGAATGMGIMGAGIGAFIAGMAAVGDIAAWMGADGSGIKTMLTNVGEGLSSFNFGNLQDLDGDKISNVLGGIAQGLASITKAELLSSISNVGTTFLNFVAGDDSPMNQILTLADNAGDLEKAGNALDALATALGKFADIGTGAQVDIQKLAMSAAGALPILRGLSEGGSIGEGLWDGPEIDFGPMKGPGKGGIFDEDLSIDQMMERAAKVRNVLAGLSGSAMTSEVESAASSVTGTASIKPDIAILSNYTEKMIELSQNILRSLEVIESNVPQNTQQTPASFYANNGNTDARQTSTSININNNQSQKDYSELKYTSFTYGK